MKHYLTVCYSHCTLPEMKLVTCCGEAEAQQEAIEEANEYCTRQNVRRCYWQMFELDRPRFEEQFEKDKI